ncbi:MAG: hypothetical protein KJO98_09855 [Rhodothermia bacterium]|nr:hypothetical protein [Rhodothermia bacterium]
MLIAILILPQQATAQDEEQPTLYVQVDCMKSTSADYENVETEIWQPMHQAMVNQGKKNTWALYWVLYGDRSDCDYYTVNTYLGEEQLNDPTSFADVFATVHPDKDWNEIGMKTNASREMVWTELWTWVDGIPPGEHQYAQVNQMRAHDGTNALRKEREIWKPIHQVLKDEGHRAGWGLYSLWTPYGTSMPYNYGTVDFLKKLGPAPVAQAAKTAHPDWEMAAIGQVMEDARDLVHGETWMLVASVQAAGN